MNLKRKEGAPSPGENNSPRRLCGWPRPMSREYHINARHLNFTAGINYHSDFSIDIRLRE